MGYLDELYGYTLDDDEDRRADEEVERRVARERRREGAGGLGQPVPEMRFSPGETSQLPADMNFGLDEAAAPRPRLPGPGYRRPAPLAPGGMPPGAGGALGAPTPEMNIPLYEAEGQPLPLPRLPYRPGQPTPRDEFTFTQETAPSPPATRLPAFDVTAGRFADAPRPPIDMPFLPYEGEEPPERLDALRAAGEPAPIELPDFDVASGRFEDAAPGLARIYRPPAGSAKPGEGPEGGPKQALNQIGQSGVDGEYLSLREEQARRQRGQGIRSFIGRLLGGSEQAIQAAEERVDDPMEELVARRGREAETAREQRLGQERTRQLDLEGQRLTQQQAAAEQARQDRLARDATRDDFSRQRIAIAQQRADQGRRRGGGGGGGVAPGAAGATDSDFIAALMDNGHTQESAERLARQMPLSTRQGRTDRSMVLRNLGAQMPSRQQVQNERATRGMVEEDQLIEGLRQVDAAVPPEGRIPGVGGWHTVLDVFGGQDPNGVLNTLHRQLADPDANAARQALTWLRRPIRREDFGATVTNNEFAEMVRIGAMPTNTPEEIREAVAASRRLLGAMEARRTRSTPRGIEERLAGEGGTPPPAEPAAAPSAPAAPQGRTVRFRMPGEAEVFVGSMQDFIEAQAEGAYLAGD